MSNCLEDYVKLWRSERQMMTTVRLEVGLSSHPKRADGESDGDNAKWAFGEHEVFVYMSMLESLRLLEPHGAFHRRAMEHVDIMEAGDVVSSKCFELMKPATDVAAGTDCTDGGGVFAELIRPTPLLVLSHAAQLTSRWLRWRYTRSGRDRDGSLTNVSEWVLSRQFWWFVGALVLSITPTAALTAFTAILLKNYASVPVLLCCAIASTAADLHTCSHPWLFTGIIYQEQLMGALQGLELLLMALFMSLRLTDADRCFSVAAEASSPNHTAAAPWPSLSGRSFVDVAEVIVLSGIVIAPLITLHIAWSRLRTVNDREETKLRGICGVLVCFVASLAGIAFFFFGYGGGKCIVDVGDDAALCLCSAGGVSVPIVDRSIYIAFVTAAIVFEQVALTLSSFRALSLTGTGLSCFPLLFAAALPLIVGQSKLHDVPFGTVTFLFFARALTSWRRAFSKSWLRVSYFMFNPRQNVEESAKSFFHLFV